MPTIDNAGDIALNRNILGNSIPPSRARATTSIKVDELPAVDYDPKYFETIPTAWAAAYEFEGLLRQNDKVAVEEWVCLLTLHFFGIIGIARLTEKQINDLYEPRLWKVLSGTFPAGATTPLEHIDLLRDSTGTIVGGCYQETIFFPGRDRAAWRKSNLIGQFIDGERLSWRLCSEHLLREAGPRQRLYDHLSRLIFFRLKGALRERLSEFRQHASVFRNQTERSMAELSALEPDSYNWTIDVDLSPQTLLSSYPLRRQNNLGGTTYYLINGMPGLSDWMLRAPSGKPTPLQFRLDPMNRAIIVNLAKGPEICPLGEHDRAIYLSSLFLDEEKDFTYFSKSPVGRSPHIRRFHRHEVRQIRGLFSDLNSDDMAICLAPVRADLLREFPELLQSPDDRISLTPVNGPEGISFLEWRFNVDGANADRLEILWRCVPNYSKDLFITSLSLWPPQVSPDWNLYLMHGQGQDPQSNSVWKLIDENGQTGTLQKLSQDSYVTMLLGNDGHCRPRALYLSDRNSERGVFFLAELPEKRMQNSFDATLAVDFGTSNTCLAYKYSGQGSRSSKPNELRFSLAPRPIWELAPSSDLPGFIPTSWGGEKGFFPTALLRKFDAPFPNDARDIGIQHLFSIDIPSLHSKELVDRWVSGEFRDRWVTHAESELKWKHGENEPWRSLFLTLVILYAQAELFFTQDLVVREYVCTYPLSFTPRQRKRFLDSTRQVITKVRSFCYSKRLNPEPFQDLGSVSESTAVATFIEANPQTTAIDIFVDVGGGTTDIAVRYREDFLVLDSLRVAGRSFFEFSQRNYDLEAVPGSAEFKKYLHALLTGTEKMGHEWKLIDNFDLATQYSVSINKVSDDHIEKVEERIIDQKMGDKSFQRYRSQLFFRHLLAYALIQGFGAALRKLPVSQGSDHDELLVDGFHLILGGNAWGLLMFGEFQRSSDSLKEQADKIVNAIKEILIERVDEGDKRRLKNLKITRLELLNEAHLTKAKTAAALGALNAMTSSQKTPDTISPYTGITIPSLRVNKEDIFIRMDWKERWGLSSINALLNLNIENIDQLAIQGFTSLRRPIDPLLSIFCRLGNPAQPHVDPMPDEEWERINSALINGSSYLDQGQLRYSPLQLFLTDILYPEKTVHARLEKLAAVTGHFKR